MAIEKLQIEEFLELSLRHPVLDVRSPQEYQHAHIPGAYSLPLFNDEERKVVGTTYKQNSREEAIKVGLDYFGVKMKRMVEEVERIVTERSRATNSNAQPKFGKDGDHVILVHCWRGGMRSAGVAWLLDLYGFKVHTLSGGYKQFRRWTLESLDQPREYRVLGGYTGSGKTPTLLQLQVRGEAVIDLEGLAHHKGSAFGALNQPPQPAQEQFENLIALELFKLARRFPGKPVWVEDESQRIGSVGVPMGMWNHMRNCPLYFLDIPFDVRNRYLVQTYGKLNRGDLAAAITRIQKKLGGLETKTALHHLIENEMDACFSILLHYYDKLYNKGLHRRENLEQLLVKIPAGTVDADRNAQLILQS